MLISSIFGFSIGLSCGLLLCLPNNYLSSVTDTIVDIVISTEVDTTVDSLYYESIDTTIIHYPWGREEIYYFKYKEN